MSADLRRIDTWLFDLDNTLYPPEAEFMSLIVGRMTRFVARETGLPPAEAFALQKKYLSEHGTTLAGLMAHHGVEPEAFLNEVHDVSLDSLIPDPNITGAAATATSTTTSVPTGYPEVFSSLASGEVASAALSLTLDATYTLTVTPALGTDAYLEVMVDGAIVPSTTLPTPQGPFVFSSTLPGPYTLTLTGNSLDFTNPIWHFLQIRLVSTSATVVQPNVNVTVKLTYVPPS